MQLKSIQEVETLKATIRKVDAEIMHRRLAIRNNTIANAGIARNEVEMMARQQQQRKAYLHTFRGQIEALYRADGGRHDRMRTSFIQPRTPKSERVSISDRKTGDYYIDGKKVSKSEYKMFRKMGEKEFKRRKQQALTRKQRKKISKPIPSIDMKPIPKSSPAMPPQRLNEAADKARQDAHVLAANKAEAIRKQLDAKRDAELVAQGKAKLVAQRRASEEAKRQEERKRNLSRKTTQLTNKVTKRAASAERSARSMASRFANKRINKSRISRGRFQPSRRGSRGSGFVPQLAVMMSLTDKRRAATVNQVTRTPDKVIPGPIKDQITEDIRQHKPLPNPNRRSPEFMAFMEEITPMYKMAYKEINLAKQGKGNFGYLVKTLGPQRTQFYASKAFALLGEIKQLVSNEAIRWEQGALNSGVAVSTDTRAQSKRKMTLQEFAVHIEKKFQPKVQALFKEIQEEVTRTMRERAARSKPAEEKVVLDNSLAVNRQRTLASSDKLRGHGRPVLSEQQGTKGLAGLFPALRSSMQGA